MSSGSSPQLLSAERVVQVGSRGTLENIPYGVADVSWPAREDLAENRPQREDVGSLVDPVQLAHMPPSG